MYTYMWTGDGQGKTHLEGDFRHYFCSLRCKNAYLASKGIKEQRYRVIPHE